MKPKKFKRILSKKLELKPLVASFDFAKYLFNIISMNRDFFKYMPWADIKKPEQEYDFLRNAERKWKENTEANYGIYLRSSGDFVGVCSLFHIDWDNESGEVGYWLDPEHANHGFMTEAIKALTKEFFVNGFCRIVIMANVENTASRKVAERSGFIQEGILKSYEFNTVLGKREDLVLYAKINNR